MADECTAGGVEPIQDAKPLDRMSGLRLAGALRTLLQYHQQMGIEQYPLSPALQRFLCPDADGRQAQPDEGERLLGRAIAPKRTEAACPEQPGKATALLQDLRREIDGCRQCSLASARQGVVHASGPVEALLLVVGDYSAQSGEFSAATLFGEAEDAMLWNMMRAIGLAPEQVYVTNAVKCCPQSSGIPGDDSVRCCHAYLMRELELVRPRVVCAMGEIAVHSLVAARKALVRMRGRFYPWRPENSGGEPLQVMATFHPRLLVQNVELKQAVWQDLQSVQRQLQAR